MEQPLTIQYASLGRDLPQLQSRAGEALQCERLVKNNSSVRI